MTRLIGRAIQLNNSTRATSTTPQGLGISYSDSAVRSHTNSVGYLMPGYSRPMSVTGVRNETMFWDFCTDCPLYQKRECTGGYKTLASEPRVDHARIQNIEGSDSIRYYSREFCKMHYGTNKLRQSLNSPGSLTANLLPHFFSLRGSTAYWYTYRINEADRKLEFVPYQIFNTYATGEICYGGIGRDSYSLPERYEGFFNARVNNDLIPVNMNVADWIRSFSTEELIRRHPSLNWKDHTACFGADHFDVVPAIFRECKFVQVNLATAPDFISEEHPNINTILPFLRRQDNTWVCSKDINTVITDENWHDVYTYLT